MFSTSRDITKSCFLLIYHYFLQGITIGLIEMYFPIKLKENHFTFSEIGIYMLCKYPFSLKLLWAPIVDTYYFKFLGLRKTWIIGSQTLCGFILLILVYYYEILIQERNIFILSCIAISSIFAIATQDIALDALALKIIDKQVTFHNITNKFNFNPIYSALYIRILLPNFGADWRINF